MSREENFLFSLELKVLVSSALPCFFAVSFSVSQSLNLTLLSFPLFSLTLTLKVFFSCVCSDPQNWSFPPPFHPLFSLASSVSIAKGQPGAVLTLQAYWLRKGEKKNCGHDSPCMNLMIPGLSAPPLQWRREQINSTPFLSPSLQACQ